MTPSSAPELARRRPFPAVTHPTRRGLARHIRVNSDGTTLLCVRRRNRTPAVVLLELANCTIRIRVDPHSRERADFNICPPYSPYPRRPFKTTTGYRDDFADDSLTTLSAVHSSDSSDAFDCASATPLDDSSKPSSAYVSFERRLLATSCKPCITEAKQLLFWSNLCVAKIWLSDVTASFLRSSPLGGTQVDSPEALSSGSRARVTHLLRHVTSPLEYLMNNSHHVLPLLCKQKKSSAVDIFCPTRPATSGFGASVTFLWLELRLRDVAHSLCALRPPWWRLSPA